MLDVLVLGPIEARLDGATITIGSRSQRILLAALAHARGRAVSVDRLAALVWGDEAPSQVSNALKSHVSRLRRRLVEEVVVARPPGYALSLDLDRLDVHRFEQGLSRARTVEQLDAVLGLWRGAPYGELAEHGHVAGDVTRLVDLRYRGRLRRAELLQAVGRHDEAVAELRSAVNAEPLREPTWVELLRALQAAGRQADATAAARRYRELVAEVGLEPSPAFVAAEQQVFLPLPSVPSRPHRLPPRLTSVVGRDEERRHLVELLAHRRIVTLVGPGGTGKSTLAVEVARAASASVPDGTWVAELADVEEASSVVAAVVRAVRAPTIQPLQRSLQEYLASRHALLVLDNAEHVRGEVRSLVHELAGAADELRVLITSRQPLDVPGEVVVPVDPLSPEPALALFRERAADAGARIGDADAEAAAAVCDRLDRLPLAIEMAAARLRGLDLSDLAARLDDRLRLLRSAEQGRHETLGAVIGWSYDLLDAQQQRLLGQLSVFAGPFDLAAAEAVCAGCDVALGVGDLVERSLVVVDAGPTRARYRLLETVRSFASERLAVSGDAAPTLDRFVAHCVDLAERVSAGLRGPDEARCAALLDEQTSNLEAAHARALEAGAMDAAVRIAAAPYVLVYQRLRADIGAWAEATLPAAVGSDHPLAAVVAAIAALNRLNRGDPEGAAELLSELPDDPLARHGHEVLGDLHTYRGDLTSAFDHFDRAAELARTAEDDFTAGFARASAAITLGYAGRVDEALALAAQVRSAARAAGSELVVCWCDYAEAEALTERDPLHALELVDRVVGRADAAGWQMLAGVGRLTASSLRARVADPEDAIPGFQRLIGHWDRLGDQTHQWTTLRNLVELLTRLEASVPAARLLGAVGHAPTPTFGPEQRRLDEAATRLRHHLGGRFDELVRDGQVDELTDAVDHALRALAELPS